MTDNITELPQLFVDLNEELRAKFTGVLPIRWEMERQGFNMPSYEMFCPVTTDLNSFYSIMETITYPHYMRPPLHGLCLPQHEESNRAGWDSRQKEQEKWRSEFLFELSRGVDPQVFWNGESIGYSLTDRSSSSRSARVYSELERNARFLLNALSLAYGLVVPNRDLRNAVNEKDYMEALKAMANEAKWNRHYVVYLVGHPRGLTKIGKSTNILQRLDSFQVASPIDCYLYGVLTLQSENAASFLERCLHLLFKTKRKKGEWFELSFSAILRELFLFAPEVSLFLSVNPRFQQAQEAVNYYRDAAPAAMKSEQAEEQAWVDTIGILDEWDSTLMDDDGQPIRFTAQHNWSTDD